MSKLSNLKKKAADLEQRRLFDKALTVYEEVLQEQDGAEEADVGLFNRVGDLHLRQGNIEAALKRYEQAVDLYVERGFQNNAIALCNKILRQDPSRAEIHFRLGQISCSKGFRTEARRHFQEYVAQLNRAGSLERAITSLRDFANENEELDDVRQMFADILVTHGRLADAVTELGRLHEQFESEQRHAEAQTVLGRILELDPGFSVVHAAPSADALEHGPDGDGPLARVAHSHRSPAALDLVLFEPTDIPAATHSSAPSLQPPAAVRGTGASGVLMDAASTLGMEAGQGRAEAAPTAAERLGDGLELAAQPLLEMPDGLIRGADFDDAEAVATPSPAPLDLALEPTAVDPTALDGGLLELDAPPLSGFEGNDGGDVADLLDVTVSGPPAEPVVLAAAWDVDGGAWEIPDLAEDDQGPGSAVDLTFPDDAASGATESDPERTGEDVDDPASELVFLSDGVTDLDGGRRVEDDAFTLPDRVSTPEWSAATPADPIILSAGSVADHVDATAAGGAPMVGDDPFVGPDEPAPPSPAGASPSDREEPRPEPSKPVAAAPAAPAAVAIPAPLEPAPAEEGAFVNLGDWLREDDEPRSTRMVTEERAPTGDEDADFAEMLRKFKQGVADNVDENDYASHYDLGIAFREMGLVDEAIAAFQRALRGTVQRVRAFEALGQCFLDKEQFAVAASVLQRALQEPGADDERLVGVLYLLGRAAEAQNQRTDALRYYQRVFAVDIEFGDVADRIGTVERVPL